MSTLTKLLPLLVTMIMFVALCVILARAAAAHLKSQQTLKLTYQGFSTIITFDNKKSLYVGRVFVFGEYVYFSARTLYDARIEFRATVENHMSEYDPDSGKNDK